MKILLTNDDALDAPGLAAAIRILKPLGDLTIVAPKFPQSGMSMAITMGFKPIAVKHIGIKDDVDWWYLDGTPSSCVKFGLDNVLYPVKPDLVVSGINHGTNVATASLYSGTVGAAMEGAINGIPSIAISLDSFSPHADFSACEEHLPGLLERLIPNMSSEKGVFYNINVPSVAAAEIKGTRVCPMGMAHWEKEYRIYDAQFRASMPFEAPLCDIEYARNAQDGEEMYVMAGDFTPDENNPEGADHLMLSQGFITVTPENINNTDYREIKRLCDII